MIKSILFFTLGFLCAGFLALMVAPAIWRRAAALTRKRIEASVPLSLNDIQADKDRMRAEFAMSTRRLEMSIKAFKDKASAQIIEINRNREELKRLASVRDEKNQSISELEAKAGELRGELRQREDQLQRLEGRLSGSGKGHRGARARARQDGQALRRGQPDGQQQADRTRGPRDGSGKARGRRAAAARPAQGFRAAHDRGRRRGKGCPRCAEGRAQESDANSKRSSSAC